MNTLHMYHWQNTDLLKKNLALIGANDSLVIFGSISESDLKEITHKLTSITYDWYIVKDIDSPHINSRIINKRRWLNLIIKHRNTLAWK